MTGPGAASGFAHPPPPHHSQRAPNADPDTTTDPTMTHARLLPAALLTLACATPLFAQLPRAEQTRPDNVVLTHRQEDPLIRERLADRFDNLLPELMRREGFDMWLVITREYNSDAESSASASGAQTTRAPSMCFRHTTTRST